MPPLPPQAAPFLGWRVLAAAFVAQLVATACTFSAFGVFVVPLAEEFDTSRGAISSGLGLAMLVMGLAGPFLGRAIDQGPLRAIMLAGVGLLCAGMLLLSRTTALWQAGLVFCTLVALGGAMFGALPSMALVGNWFVRRRGLALGIAVAGATVASLATPPLAALLIEARGWRGAVVVLGIGAALLAAPVFWAFVVRRPEDVGQAPDGDAGAAGFGAAQGVPLGPATGALLRDPRLWILAVGFALVFGSPIVMGIHLVPFAEDLGFTPVRAALFFTVVGPFSLLGKVAFGAFADRVDPRRALWLALTPQAVAWCLLLTGPGYALLLFAGAVFGLGVGAVAPLHGVVVGACFGRGAFGRVMGIGGLAGLPLVAGAGPLAGFLYDATGSYQLAFALQVASMVCAALLLSFLRIPEVEPGTAPAPGVGAPAASARPAGGAAG